MRNPVETQNSKTVKIAKTVIMINDPIIVENLSKKYLCDLSSFSIGDHNHGYTGTFKNEQISIVGSGIGNPSMGVYSFELYSQYDVERIIKIGRATSYSKDIESNDIVLVNNVWSDSNYGELQGVRTDTISSSTNLNKLLFNTAKRCGISIQSIKLYSTDVKYTRYRRNYEKIISIHQCAAVEMESYALFCNAQIFDRSATTLAIISDNIYNENCLSKEEISIGLDRLFNLTMDAIVR